MEQVAFGVAPIGYGYNDYIALIALYIFEVLDEKGLRRVRLLFEVVLTHCIMTRPLIQKFFDKLALLEVQCNNPKRILRMRVYVVEDRVYHTLASGLLRLSS